MNLFSRLQGLFGGKSAGSPRPAADTAPADSAWRWDDAPPFHLGIAEAMRFDPQVRVGLGARNGLLMAAEVEVLGEPSAATRWVQAQWDRLWAAAAQSLLRTKLYGYLPFEAKLRRTRGGAFDGLIEVAGLVARRPAEVRLFEADGEPAGFVWLEADPPRVVAPPRGLVCTFDAEFGNPYGCSLLARAYPAWCEKWMSGGAKKTLRLRMIKDAYIGDIFWYPPDRQAQLPSGETVSWRDLARELVETRLSGGAMTLPLVYDRDGRRLLDYTPPRDVGGATAIFEWKRDVDQEIWKALEVPPEVIEASTRGSFSGRSIPLTVALAAAQVEFAELARCVDRDLLRPLARLNFGTEPTHELRPRSLLEIYRRRGE